MKDLIVNVFSVIISFITCLVCIRYRNQFDFGIFITIAGGFLILSGIILLILSKSTLGDSFTITFAPKGFTKKGIYSKIRHPMYVGAFLLFLGTGIMLQSIAGIILTLIFIVPLLTYSALEEEKQMFIKYGNEYILYKKKTVL